jgi:hypothetical protein
VNEPSGRQSTPASSQAMLTRHVTTL